MNDSEETRALIGRVARDDDKAAAEKLLRLYSPLVESMAASFARDAEENPAVLEKDDLLQEASIALLKAAKSFDLSQTNVTFGLYAKICIRNSLISALRRSASKSSDSGLKVDHENRDGADEDQDTEFGGQGDNPLDRVIEKESYANLMKILSEVLSDLEKSVLGCYLDGKSYLETAKMLSVSVKTVDNAVYRIKTKLKKLL